MEDLADQVDEVDRLRAGDASAWEALFRRVYPKMISYAERRLGPGEPARDAVSEAVTRAVAGVDRLAEAAATPDAWFIGILAHVVMDEHRRNYRRRDVKQTRVVEEEQPMEQLLLDEEHTAVRVAFDRLPDRDRDVLELRVIAGLSADDVGRALDMRPGAVRTAQGRALGRLRALLGDGGGEQ